MTELVVFATNSAGVETMVRINDEGYVQVDERTENVWRPIELTGGTFRIAMSGELATVDIPGDTFPTIWQMNNKGRLDVCPVCRSIHALDGPCSGDER
jgi:hypothetical protein